MSITTQPSSASGRQRVQPVPTRAYLAVVTKIIDTASAKVLIRGISTTHDFTALAVEGIITQDLDTKPTTITGGTHVTHTFGESGTHSHGPHEHRLGIDLLVGDKVLVLPLGGDAIQWIIVARMP